MVLFTYTQMLINKIIWQKEKKPHFLDSLYPKVNGEFIE